METRILENWGRKMIKTSIPCKKNANKQITITTMKRVSGTVATTAQEETINGDMIEFMPFQDFTKTLVNEKIRATEKAMINQHNTGLNVLKSDAYYIENYL